MTKRVLSIGNCGFDHGNISATIRQSFGAEVIAASTSAEAFAALQDGPYDLVMVNRVFETNGDSGLDLIKRIKTDSQHGQTPVLLISNHADAQEQALALGAVPGFGKTQVGKPHMIEALRPFLG